MRVFACDHHEVPLPERHPFPMGKYRLLRETLLERGIVSADELAPAPLAEPRDLLRVHDPDYVRQVLDGLPEEKARRVGFPWSQALVRRCLASVGGTIAASDAALTDGLAGNLAGGTHHAHRDLGSGYCVFNDIAVAARRLLQAGRVRRVLVFDVDVHQGDGTAALFADEPAVFTCSIHGARNFPARKPASDLDVALPDGTGDAAYLDALADALQTALAAGRPDLVFYQGGVDPLASDRLGRLSLSHAGLRRRDEHVLGTLVGHRVPVVLTLGGGYAEPIEDSVAAHVGTYDVARRLQHCAGPTRRGAMP